MNCHQQHTQPLMQQPSKRDSIHESEGTIKSDRDFDRQQYIVECKRLLSGLRKHQL
jgi:hypothetical protein